jgi:hypothetical protein
MKLNLPKQQRSEQKADRYLFLFPTTGVLTLRLSVLPRFILLLGQHPRILLMLLTMAFHPMSRLLVLLSLLERWLAGRQSFGEHSRDEQILLSAQSGLFSIPRVSNQQVMEGTWS